MMVPESDVGVEKPFSFAQEQTSFGGNGLGANGLGNLNSFLQGTLKGEVSLYGCPPV